MNISKTPTGIRIEIETDHRMKHSEVNVLCDKFEVELAKRGVKMWSSGGIVFDDLIKLDFHPCKQEVTR